MPDPSGPRPRTFRSTVAWPRGELVAVLVVSAVVGACVGFRRAEPVYGQPAYGLLALVSLACLGLSLWALARVLKAWVNWPSRNRLVRWLKAAIRFVFLGPKEPGE